MNDQPVPIDRFIGDHRWLSNFYILKVPIWCNGIPVTTLEHGFQAAKCVNAADRARVSTAKGPGAAKRMGRQVELCKDWEEIKEFVMAELLRRKFTDPELREKLIATGDRNLIEGNPHGDKYWGCTKDPPDARWFGADGRVWYGRNRLGAHLMLLRQNLTQLGDL